MTIHEYGEVSVFREEDVPKPTAGAHDVLVRVCAASVNPVDWKIRSGGQRNIIRLRFPWILGLDVSGVVEAIGAKVTRFRVGDEVFSSPRHTRPGTYAEYVCIDEREVAKKPKNLTHDEAASIPLVGLTAYQCVVEKGRLAPGQTMLVHAGSGGVGAFAIQLGKHLGAHVITTCSAKNADFVRDLGAERVIDYTKESFGDVVADVDLILDSMGESAFDGNLRAVRRGGRISNISVDVPGLVARYGPFFSLFVLVWTMIRFHLWPLLKKGVRLSHVIKRCDGNQLAVLAALCESGAIRPTVERVFPLERVKEAHELSETHRARGKIVLHVAD
jgi:NADPH:quinone reductase-like Zn-dependent oxidoreductase